MADGFLNTVLSLTQAWYICNSIWASGGKLGVGSIHLQHNDDIPLGVGLWTSFLFSFSFLFLSLFGGYVVGWAVSV